MAAGKTLYNEALALHNAQKKEYGEQVAATAELNDLWERAEQQYMKTLKIARVAFRGNAKADKAIMLYGDRKQSLWGWLGQARAFYGNIVSLEDFLNPLTEFGYTKDKLIQESAILDQIDVLYKKQQQETGEAQAATQSRDKKIDELAKWVSDLRAVAKVALADDPQQLEKLGILARTSPASKSQKPAESGQSTKSE